MNISTLSPNDWEKYKIIRLQALQENSEAFGSSYKKEVAFSDETWQEKCGNKKVCIVMAEENSEPIGMVGYHIKYEGDVHLWGMFVSKNYRGQGIGKKLMQQIIEKAKELSGLQTISLDVNPDQVSAVKLYESMGFVKSGIRNYLMGDGIEHTLTTMVMKVA